MPSPRATSAAHLHPFRRGLTSHRSDTHGVAPRRRPLRTGEKPWHDATASTGMTQIAIQEAEDGSAATWMEQVTDEDYGG